MEGSIFVDTGQQIRSIDCKPAINGPNYVVSAWFSRYESSIGLNNMKFGTISVAVHRMPKSLENGFAPIGVLKTRSIGCWIWQCVKTTRGFVLDMALRMQLSSVVSHSTSWSKRHQIKEVFIINSYVHALIMSIWWRCWVWPYKQSWVVKWKIKCDCPSMCSLLSAKKCPQHGRLQHTGVRGQL